MVNAIQAGNIYAVVEQRAPTEPHWTLVRRYCVPGDSNFDRLFGIAALDDAPGPVKEWAATPSIAPKGKPDNVSAGTAEWVGEQRQSTAFKKARLQMEFTCVTQGTVAKVVGGVSEDLLLGGDDDCVSAYFGLPCEWHDGSRAAMYRLVAWRMVEPEVVEDAAESQ